MLTELKIQNYALIRELEISFESGLNTITGETGTGKSIILGALGLILGNRADTTALLDDSRKCIIEGRFSIGQYPLQAFFQNNDLDWEEHTYLRREINPNGKSRAFINDTPVGLNILKELGESLVDIHSQHQTIKLTEPAFQLALLDAFAGHKSLLEEYAKQFRQYRSIKRKLEDWRLQAAQAQKDYDYNLFQLNEINQANLKSGEQEALEEELGLLGNAESIKQNLQQAIYLLEEDEQSINNRLAEIRRNLGSVANLNTRLEGLYKRIDDLLLEGRDVQREMGNLQDEVVVDDQRMEELNLRLQTIQHLLQKHQCRTVDDILAYANELQKKTSIVESMASESDEMQTQLLALENGLNKLATDISKNRHKQTEILKENLEALLRQVGIPEAQIIIKLEDLPALGNIGKDAMEIYFSANRGSRPGPVSQVASGGELSRLMLCFKYLLADNIFLPTIIFDEIDTGVSGEVAIQVGRIMKKLSGTHQLMCITHNPQVAAMGIYQYRVFKISGDDITTTHINQLSKEERIEEIAQMIAGHKPSSLAIESAKELLAASA